MILPYQVVKKLCIENKLVYPWYEKTEFQGLSYGLSEAGYDCRIAQTVKLYPVTLKNLILNALGFKRPSFVLASTIERFCTPNYLMPQVLDKSTWARKGIAVQNTTCEPGWFGYLTLEITLHGPEPVTIECGAPIAQMVFHTLTEPTIKEYIGKYQNQINGVQKAIMDQEARREVFRNVAAPYKWRPPKRPIGHGNDNN